MNSHRRVGYVLWLGACLIVGLLAGCGGSSSGTASAGVSTATSAATGGTAAAGGVTGGSATASGGTAVAGNSGTSAVATGGGTTVMVIAKDYSFALDKSTVPAGTVTFVMTNQGPSVHNFSIMGKTSDTIAMGAQTSLTVTLAPGMSPYVCTVPGHEQLGMKGTLTVT